MLKLIQDVIETKKKSVLQGRISSSYEMEIKYLINTLLINESKKTLSKKTVS